MAEISTALKRKGLLVGWRKGRQALAGIPIGPALILATVIVTGIFGPWFAPYDPTIGDLSKSLEPPFWQEGGSTGHLLGTDNQGRDILSRLIVGARISLIVGASAVFLAGFLGTLAAMISGYFGGWVDAAIMRVTEVFLSMPYLMVAIILAGVLGPSVRNLIFTLGFLAWPQYARVLRGEVLRVRELEYIKLARVAGCGWGRILLMHVFPNIANTLIVLATLQLGITIIAEASLSFLGLGVPPPNPAWGLMLAEGRQYLRLAWWMVTLPGIAIVLTVLGSNLLGDWLRLRLDPKYRQL